MEFVCASVIEKEKRIFPWDNNNFTQGRFRPDLFWMHCTLHLIISLSLLAMFNNNEKNSSSNFFLLYVLSMIIIGVQWHLEPYTNVLPECVVVVVEMQSLAEQNSKTRPRNEREGEKNNARKFYLPFMFWNPSLKMHFLRQQRRRRQRWRSSFYGMDE
jgi:hypothetical protein